MNISDPSALTHQNAAILTVMSSARDDFGSKYDIIREIGKGGFSTVYQTKDRRTGKDYAVKIVDLRPLRLRERFNPLRLRREVDIMKRLHHPNIIQFVDVFEDNDNLMMVMEYCPGQELFDVILDRKFFHEEDARPIFVQIARALYYLHSLNILHRDVKPENVLVSSIPDAQGNIVAKLLDFGLSKNAGNGSAAKTFVGTPCYVAPEVEYTSKGLGGTYSFPADCWSLGALLYVMLVARFPEFEQDSSGKIVVKLSPSLWGSVSSEAKDLIRSLMNTNPAARLTMGSTLMHPWLKQYRATQEELSRVAVSSYDLSRKLQEEETRLAEVERQARAAVAHANHMQSQGMREEPTTSSHVEMHRIDSDSAEDIELTSTGAVVHHQAMVVVRNNLSDPLSEAVVPATKNPDHGIQLAPLLHLQRSIATCFDEVHASYKDLPEVASEIREGASLCREQLTQSMKMLRQVEQTAAAVLSMFPDLELAVEEGEPQLALNFFATVKVWVKDLRELVNSTQSINKASMHQIQLIVERSTIGLLERQKQNKANKISLPRKLLDTAMVKLGLAEKANELLGSVEVTLVPDSKEDKVEIDADHVLDLFMSLFGSGGVGPNGHSGATNLDESDGSGAPEGFFGRVFSIDSDSRTLDATSTNSGGKQTPPLPPGTTAALHGNAATSKSLLQHLNSNTSNLSTTSAISTRSTSLTPSHTPRDASLLPPVSSPEPSYPSYAMDLEEDEEEDNIVDVNRNNSYGSNASSTSSTSQISLDNFTPLMPGNLPVPPHLLMDDKSKSNGQYKSHENAAAHLADALKKLRQVDMILEELSVFWANTEVVLDLLSKKGEHVEQFVGFASKPKLKARFLERMEEYKRFWENVSMMCSNYIAGVQTTNEQQRMYGFLDLDSQSSHSSSKTSTPSHLQQSLQPLMAQGTPRIPISAAIAGVNSMRLQGTF